MPDHDREPQESGDGAHDRARAWLSAARDGEAAEDPAARAHLAACSDCARWQSALAGAELALAATAAPAPPGLAAPALAAYAGDLARPSTRERAARVLLTAAGVAGMVLAALSLTGAAAVHAEHDLLGFEVAFAVGFLLCARDPARYSRALLPITAVASLVVLLPSAAAAASSPVDLLAEAGHLSVLAGLAGLLLLSSALPPATTAANGRGGPLPTMAR